MKESGRGEFGIKEKYADLSIRMQKMRTLFREIPENDRCARVEMSRVQRKSGPDYRPWRGSHIQGSGFLYYGIQKRRIQEAGKRGQTAGIFGKLFLVFLLNLQCFSLGVFHLQKINCVRRAYLVY